MSMQNRRVLIVDDEVDICANLADIMQDLGYQVDTANSGEAALELVKQNPYDLALLDLKMPGMNGLELYRRIRELSAGTVAIVVTAYASSDTAQAVMAAGAWKIMSKPVDIEKLLALIKHSLETPLILIVDDDRDLCDNLWDLLRLQSCRAYLAFDLPEAEKATREHEFDVVLVDMTLPGGEGGQLIRAMRDANKDTRTLLITGHSQMQSQVQEALAAGANAICYKPFDVVQLLATVQDLCAQHGRL
ncbi:MAG: response regulator [Candidatus Binatia bacterium]